MDPISIGASVIAIATLATKICSALSDQRELCGSLPGRLHAVSNEVADLSLVLLQVYLLIRSRAFVLESSFSAIPYLLKQAISKLLEIKDSVSQRTVGCRASKMLISRAHAWRKEQSRLQVLQEEIRTVKTNLNIILGALNSYADRIKF